MFLEEWQKRRILVRSRCAAARCWLLAGRWTARELSRPPPHASSSSASSSCLPVLRSRIHRVAWRTLVLPEFVVVCSLRLDSPVRVLFADLTSMCNNRICSRFCMGLSACSWKYNYGTSQLVNQ